MTTLELGVYQLVSGDGPQYLARPMVDAKERLLFVGPSAEDVEQRARAWYAKNFLPKPAPTAKPKQEAAPDADIFG